jgi:hypothetical protein
MTCPEMALMLRLPSTTTHPLFLASFLLAFLDLNCLVRDQSLNDIFAIKIARSESVSILQQSIKRVRGLKPDAPPSMLWKVLSLDEVGDIDTDGRCQVDFPIEDEIIITLRNSGPLDPDKGFHQLSPMEEL